jgi:hypothetical protein
MTTAEWAQFIGFGIAGAFGLVCVFDGARRIAGGHAGRGRGGRLAVGVAIVAILGGYAFWQHRMFLDVAAAHRQQPPARELPADWGKKVSPAKREALSQGIARQVFVDSGKLTQYVEASGQRKAYAPGQDELKRREAAVLAAARVEQRAASSLVEAVLWLVLGLGALVFGLCFAFEPAPKPADDEVEPPA